MKQPQKQFDDILARALEVRKKSGIDLSLEEDLSIGIMNLVSIEEHLYFTGIKTEQRDYFDLLDEVRSVRKELLAKMIDTHEGETWCISKHLLAATMRMMEVGTKYQHDGKKDDAARVFQLGGKIYNLFWALRLKLLTGSEVRKIADDQINVHDTRPSKTWSHDDLLKRLVNCCNE